MESKSSATADGLNKTTILFVDDEANILSGLRRLLRPLRKQWNFEFAVGGAQAIEVVNEKDVDIIVSDMRMPEIDGAELLARVANDNPGIVRMILSGQSHKHKLLEVVSKAHQFLSKPCDPEVLITAIQRAINENIADVGVDVVAPIRTIASLPAVYRELGYALSSDDANLEAIFEVAQKDIGLTAKLMQLVNSSFFGTGREAQSLYEACERLGFELLRDLFSDSEAFVNLDGQMEHASRLFAQTNAHCRKVASIATTICQCEDLEEEQQGKVHLAGMLFQIGMLVIAQRWPEKVNEIYEPGMTGKQIADRERALLSTTHCEIGANFLSLWGLDNELVESCQFYLNPELSEVDSLGPLAAVSVANRIVESEDLAIEQQLESDPWLNQIGLSHRVAKWLEALRNSR